MSTSKSLNLYRVLSGKYPIKLFGETFYIKANTIAQKYQAELYYQELVEENSALDTLKSKAELHAWLLKNNFWHEENEEKIKKYQKDIEEFKVKIFELNYKSSEKAFLKKAIAMAKDKLGLLIEALHRYDFLTPEGSALLAKNRYLIAMSVYDSKEKPVIDPSSFDNYLNDDFPLLDRIIIEINNHTLDTADIRAMARMEDWRKYWCAREVGTIFPLPVTEWTDEQLNLVSWTRIYDNIYQHPECPSDEIIEDDDALDGFLIVDKRKRDKEKGQVTAENVIGEKVAQCEEIFIPASNIEDARRVHELNSEQSKQTIAAREKLIGQQESTDHDNLPDIKLRRKLAINQKAMQLRK